MASGAPSWNGYEKGKTAIPAHHALALCRLSGVSMDWIYRGLWSAEVPFELAEKIRASGYSGAAIREMK
jgi:hypothetical protein